MISRTGFDSFTQNTDCIYTDFNRKTLTIRNPLMCPLGIKLGKHLLPLCLPTQTESHIREKSRKENRARESHKSLKSILGCSPYLVSLTKSASVLNLVFSSLSCCHPSQNWPSKANKNSTTVSDESSKTWLLSWQH